jgi:hypothetical protein
MAGLRDPKAVHRSAADAPSAFHSRSRYWWRTGGSRTTLSDPQRPRGYLTPTDYAKAGTTHHPELS